MNVFTFFKSYKGDQIAQSTSWFYMLLHHDLSSKLFLSSSIFKIILVANLIPLTTLFWQTFQELYKCTNVHWKNQFATLPSLHQRVFKHELPNNILCWNLEEQTQTYVISVRQLKILKFIYYTFKYNFVLVKRATISSPTLQSATSTLANWNENFILFNHALLFIFYVYNALKKQSQYSSIYVFFDAKGCWGET